MKKQNKTTILEYLNLDLKEIPDSISNMDDIDIKASEIRNEKNYKVYKYVPIKEINIVITNTRRLDEPAKKIESMKDLSYYFNKKNEEEYSTILSVLQNASIEDIETLEEFQKSIKTQIPTKIKYNKDYLWQIYYIKRTNKYYMIVPLQEMETQGFLYVLKKKIENSKEKIYVPICNLEYNNNFMESAKVGTLENNLYFFTNKWPMIYEVYNSKNEAFINIIGNIEIYENINTDYKMTFDKKEELFLFYELLRTLFFLQTELSNYFKFDIVLDEKGQIHFYCNDMELTNETLPNFYLNEIKNNLKNIEEVEKIQKVLTKKLNSLKNEEKRLKLELLNKQKQISTFLECKKTFFGRVKYFFKYGKKKIQDVPTPNIEENIEPQSIGKIKPLYTNDIEDLIYICKDLRTKTTVATTTRLDIQNANVKIDILKKKIENATLYIQEIEAHKKSIFEFWKFTNKDEKTQLTDGIIKTETEQKIEKLFNIKEDFPEFSKQIDLRQRRELTQEEQNAILGVAIIGTENINNLNITKDELDKLKEEENLILIDEKNIEHREKQKNIKSIMELTDKTTEKQFLLKLKEILDNLETAFKKCKLNMSMPVYSLEKPENKIMKFEINPQKFELEGEKVDLYKINLKANTNILALSNIIFFNNRNKTLPLGMDYSSNILVDLRNVNLLKIKTKTNYIVKLSDTSNKQETTKINITEFSV